MMDWLTHTITEQGALLSLPLILVIALLLDACFAEPRRFHPLVGFGHWVNWIERRFNRKNVNGDDLSRSKRSMIFSRLFGVLAVMLAILPWLFLVVWLEKEIQGWWWAELLLASVFLYSAIGWQSLRQHGFAIADPLSRGDLDAAQRALAMIVSRDTDNLDEQQIAKAAAESMLENGADAIFSAIFWFCILGIPGVVLYRLSNTLDAMWGYKNTRFLHFGWCAARLDDVLNYIPARLTALAYLLMGHRRLAYQCWRQQGHVWKSPNAGPVMAAGAGSINVSLGGMAVYHGKPEQRPLLGPEERPETLATERHIRLSLRLIDRSLLLWVISLAVIAVGLSMLVSH